MPSSIGSAPLKKFIHLPKNWRFVVYFHHSTTGASVRASQGRRKGESIIASFRLVVLISVVVLVLTALRHPAQATPSLQATASPSPVPQSQPLKLLWQADIVPDDLV